MNTFDSFEKTLFRVCFAFIVIAACIALITIYAELRSRTERAAHQEDTHTVQGSLSAFPATPKKTPESPKKIAPLSAKSIKDGYTSRAVFIAWTNIERSQRGIRELTEDVLLDTAAQRKAEDMAIQGYFAHVSPIDGRTHTSFIDATGYKRAWSGENLAKGFASPDLAQNAFMESPTHRENILSSDYTDIGIGIAQDAPGDWYVVEMFGSPEEN